MNWSAWSNKVSFRKYFTAAPLVHAKETLHEQLFLYLVSRVACRKASCTGTSDLWYLVFVAKRKKKGNNSKDRTQYLQRYILRQNRRYKPYLLTKTDYCFVLSLPPT